MFKIKREYKSRFGKVFLIKYDNSYELHFYYPSGKYCNCTPVKSIKAAEQILYSNYPDIETTDIYKY